MANNFVSSSWTIDASRPRLLAGGYFYVCRETGILDFVAVPNSWDSFQPLHRALRCDEFEIRRNWGADFRIRKPARVVTTFLFAMRMPKLSRLAGGTSPEGAEVLPCPSVRCAVAIMAALLRGSSSPCVAGLFLFLPALPASSFRGRSGSRPDEGNEKVVNLAVPDVFLENYS